MIEIQLIESSSSSYLINDNGHLFMVDCGDGKIADIQKACEAFDKSLVDLEFIILTHAHCDHAENAAELKKLSNAKLIAHQQAQKKLETGFAPFPEGTTFYNKAIAFFLSIFSSDSGEFHPVKADLLVDDTFSLKNFGVNGSVHATPGHTADSIIIILDKKYCFTGDTTFNHFPWTIYPMFANNQKELNKSWDFIHDLPNIKTFYPGHGKPFPREKFLANYRRLS